MFYFLSKNLIILLRSFNIKKQKEHGSRKERYSIRKDMSFSISHYKDIYDFDDREPRWSAERQRWVYYEGYGQGLCREKMDYLASINVEHPLWSPGGIGKSGNRIVRGDTLQMKSLAFNEEIKVKVIGGEGVISEIVDGKDRHKRTSWNFNLMLANFAEKCSSGKRKSFFLDGGYGSRWMEDMGMMKDFKRFFDWIDLIISEDKEKNIALSDQSIKKYPYLYYEQIRGLYYLFMDEKLGEGWRKGEDIVPAKVVKKSFNYNPNAVMFVPGVIYSPGLKENDEISELNRKLQLLINLHGPVVQAEQI